MTMNRRDILIAPFTVGTTACPKMAVAQGGRPPRMVQLSNSIPPKDRITTPFVASLESRITEGLKALGWEVGRNLRFDSFFSGGVADRIPSLVAEAMREPIDVIWATQTSVAVAAARATRSIPIVLAGASAYPVECGLIKSFARPGGNVTGISFFQGIAVQSKLGQFVREILPDAKRLAWIAIPADLVTVEGGEFRPEPYYAQVAHTLGFELGYYECRTPEDFDTVFAALVRWHAQAVIVEPAALSGLQGVHIADLAIQAKLPTLFSVSYNARAGGLLSYGPDLFRTYDQAVVYVDRILRGARPADLPVEMPNKLELIVNQKTARALGLTIPRSILLGADTVLE
jgi:putative ABC transport system substrate-binding protein